MSPSFLRQSVYEIMNYMTFFLNFYFGIVFTAYL